MFSSFPRGVSRALLVVALFSTAALADPLSKKTEIDFYRDIPSRNLKGLAARSDGRLVAGPSLTELTGNSPADLFWSLEPAGADGKWLVGTGPDGKIFEITVDREKKSFSSREFAKLDEPHVFALAHLPDGSVLAGTSPKGGLILIRDGKVVSRVGLPVDSIFDILVASGAQPSHALIATGNPGRIYDVDLGKFANAKVTPERTSDAKILATHGITLFGEIRDRNVRRIVRMTDGRIAAGSSPHGNIYSFDATGGSPVILQENREGEVTDLLPAADGGLFATLTFSAASGESRITPAKGGKDTADIISNTLSSPDKFGGRSSLLWFPPNGFPETLTTRVGAAFYHVARRGDLLLLTGGEQGEILGYDLHERVSLTFGGSSSSQLNGLSSIPGQDGRYLIMRNNAPGFAVLDFAGSTTRQAETRRIDLGAPSLLGALRFNRLRDVAENQLSVEAKVSNGSDEVEGWGAWTQLKSSDGAWTNGQQRGRYVKLRFKLPADAGPAVQIDRASLYALSQNRRPQLQEFRLLASNFGIIPAAVSVPSPNVSVGQLLQSGNKDDDVKAKSSFLSSQIQPMPGAQVALWTVSDPDGDSLVCTFSIRHESEETWTELTRNTSDPYVQFDTSHLKEGLYFTRLTATETDPRRIADRLSTTVETDDLVIDHTAPEILQATAKHEGDKLVVVVHGRDALSLMDGAEAIFNNGTHAQTEQPDDGIRDSRDETFTLTFPISKVADATNVEVTIYDAVGNSATKRLTW